MSSTQNMAAEQHRRVLEAIAHRASALEDLLMLLMDGPIENWRHRVLILAAQHATQVIGGMADDALVGEVAGDMNCWLYGPNFADAGKEGDAA